MKRILNVVRLQLINKSTFIWVPVIVLAASVLMSVIIYAMIPYAGPKYGGGGQAPLWVFFSVGLTAMTLTFPFSQAMSITRREFFLGTMLSAALGSAFMGVLFLIGGGIELLTNGYGLNGWVFHLPWLWEAGPVGAFIIAFTLAMLFFVVGFTGATVYKTWGPVVFTISLVMLGFILIGLAFVATQLSLWDNFWMTVGNLGALGLALWGLVVVAVLSLIAYLAFRRAMP